MTSDQSPENKAPGKSPWTWLRTLRLVLWAGLAISAAGLAGALLVAPRMPDARSAFFFFAYVCMWPLMVLLLAAPISLVLHTVALFKRLPDRKAARAGMISAALLVLAILMVMSIAGNVFSV